MGTIARTAVMVALLITWVLAPVVATASGDCMGMGGMCDGPCGAAYCATVVCVPDGVLPAGPDVVAPLADRVSSAPLQLPELPPRSPLPSA